MKPVRVLMLLAALGAAFGAQSIAGLFAQSSAASSGIPGGGPFDTLHFRDIGPAASGGRIHDLQIDPKDPAVLYVGAASGGICKSTNKGVTWRDVFGKPNANRSPFRGCPSEWNI